MDLYFKKENMDLLVEQEKNRVKEEIINQYIALRKERNLSQEKIAEMTGIARTNIVRIESKSNVPTIDILTKLAEALDMKLEIKLVSKSSDDEENS